MAESAGTSRSSPKAKNTTFYPGDFSDLHSHTTESLPVNIPARRRKYFELAYSEDDRKASSSRGAAPSSCPTSDISLSPATSITKPFFNLAVSQNMPTTETSSSLPSSRGSTPSCTPQSSPRPSPKLTRPPWSTQDEDTRRAASQANKKWFGLGSLFESKPLHQKPQRYTPNVENAAMVKKEIEEKLKLYPLPKEPEFFHQKEDSLFLHPIPRPVQPRKNKKSKTTDKDINIIAPNTF